MGNTGVVGGRLNVCPTLIQPQQIQFEIIDENKTIEFRDKHNYEIINVTYLDKIIFSDEYYDINKINRIETIIKSLNEGQCLCDKKKKICICYSTIK